MRYSPPRLPLPWAVLALVPCLVGPVARAEPPAGTVPRAVTPASPVPRAVTLLRELDLPTDPTAPMPRVRVAPGVLTSLLFVAPVVRDSVRVEGPEGRVRVVDVGASSVLLEPLVELGAEGAVLRVRFADGGVPEEAALLLVGEPLQVDNRVKVRRPAPSVEQLQATIEDLRKRCAASGLADLVLRGVVGRKDLATQSEFAPAAPSNEQADLASADIGWSARVGPASLIVVSVKNNSTDATWRPDRVALIDLSDKSQLKVRGVNLLEPEVAPGESARVVVESEAPPPGAAGNYRLEMWDSSTGRKFVVPRVELRGPKGAGSGLQ